MSSKIYLKNAQFFTAKQVEKERKESNDFGDKLASIMYSVSDYKTTGKVIGNCPTCNYKLGFNYGSNAGAFPINCGYASYSHGHIGCPVCDTTFLVGDVYDIPLEKEKAIYVFSVNQETIKELKKLPQKIKKDLVEKLKYELNDTWQEYFLNNKPEIPDTEIKLTFKD